MIHCLYHSHNVQFSSFTLKLQEAFYWQPFPPFKVYGPCRQACRSTSFLHFNAVFFAAQKLALINCKWLWEWWLNGQHDCEGPETIEFYQNLD